MATIKNIIFDLGNVLLDLDFERADQQFKAILGDHFDKAYTELKAEGHFIDYELGKFKEDHFVSSIQAAGSNAVKYEEIIKAWNSMLVKIEAIRLEMLKRLAKNYNIYLLSNTNATHLEWVNQHLIQEHLMSLQEFEQLFVRAYYSHRLHLRKPNTDIYEAVLNDSGMNAAETLFIDDSTDNVSAAKQTGIHAHQHEPSLEIADIIDELLT